MTARFRSFYGKRAHRAPLPLLSSNSFAQGNRFSSTDSQRVRLHPAMGQDRTAKTSRPDVIVDFIFDNGLFFISVENIGDRPALNVKTVFGHRLMGLHGTKE